MTSALFIFLQKATESMDWVNLKRTESLGQLLSPAPYRKMREENHVLLEQCNAAQCRTMKGRRKGRENVLYHLQLSLLIGFVCNSQTSVPLHGLRKQYFLTLLATNNLLLSAILGADSSRTLPSFSLSSFWFCLFRHTYPVLNSWYELSTFS